MGVSIAKHRLEILKLAKKEDEAAAMATSTKNLSGVIKKCLRKCLSKLVFREEEVKDTPLPPEPNWYQGKWRRALVTKHGTEELRGERGMQRSRTIAMSGPLDGRMHEKMMISNNKFLKLSGPLDGKMHERMVNRSPVRTTSDHGRFMSTAKSPRLSGPLDATARAALVSNRSPRLMMPSDEWVDSPMGYNSPYNNKIRGDSDYDENALWRTLFEDLKPT